MRLHLLGIKCLNLANFVFHFLSHFSAIRTVVGQKVNQPHGPGLADVQVCQPFAGCIGIALPPLEVERQAVGGRGRRMAYGHRWDQKTDKRPKDGTKNRDFHGVCSFNVMCDFFKQWCPFAYLICTTKQIGLISERGSIDNHSILTNSYRCN